MIISHNSTTMLHDDYMTQTKEMMIMLKKSNQNIYCNANIVSLTIHKISKLMSG